MVESMRDFVSLFRQLVLDVEGVGEGDGQENAGDNAGCFRGAQEERESYGTAHDGNPGPDRS